MRNVPLKKIYLCTSVFVLEDCLFVNSKFEPLTRGEKFQNRVNRHGKYCLMLTFRTQIKFHKE